MHPVVKPIQVIKYYTISQLSKMVLIWSAAATSYIVCCVLVAHMSQLGHMWRNHNSHVFYALFSICAVCLNLEVVMEVCSSLLPCYVILTPVQAPPHPSRTLIPHNSHSFLKVLTRLTEGDPTSAPQGIMLLWFELSSLFHCYNLAVLSPIISISCTKLSYYLKMRWFPMSQYLAPFWTNCLGSIWPP